MLVTSINIHLELRILKICNLFRDKDLIKFEVLHENEILT